jgi:hypothetical protein
MKKFDIEALKNLIEDIVSRASDVERLLEFLGEEKENNGFGTRFLKPRNEQLNNVFVHVSENGLIVTIGGNFDLKLMKIKDLVSYEECIYRRYDDLFESIFTSSIVGLKYLSFLNNKDYKNIEDGFNLNNITLYFE